MKKKLDYGAIELHFLLSFAENPSCWPLTLKYCLLINFTKSVGPDQARQNVKLFDTQMVFQKDFF